MTRASSDTMQGQVPGSPFENVLHPRAPIHEDASRLAGFLAGLRLDEVPPEVVHVAKRVILDTLGCIAAGAETTLGRQIIAAYARQQAVRGCCVPGTGLCLAPSSAAKVSAWLSDVLDYEDVASGHPSATVIPASLAMAQHLGTTPASLLTGVIAGYEAGLRVHDATRATPEAYKRLAVYHAWHGIAAGAAAMATCGATDDRMRSALGHAAANTSLPLWYIQYGKPAHALKANYGQMAHGGVEAALCAREDILGPFAMLSDAERGFWRMIGSDRFTPEELSADLGSRWRIRELSIKMFPCCAFLHPVIDAAGKLARDTGVAPERIVAVRIRGISRITEWFLDPAPASELDAQLSVQYVAAMGLTGRPAGRHWYSPEAMADPVVGALMKRMSFETDPEAERGFWEERKYRATVEIELPGGDIRQETVDWAPGHWKRPVSDAALEEKFLSNLRGTPIEARGERIITAVMALEQSDSLSPLFRLLAA